MGTGKTTVGKILARQINYSWSDLDDELIAHLKMPARDYIAKFGEPGFRQSERKVLLDLLNAPGQWVLSLGGGALQDFDIVNEAKKHCTLVFLRTSLEVLRESRLNSESERAKRAATISRLDELFLARQPFYKQSHLVIDTDSRSPREVTQRILEELEFIHELE